MRGENNRKVIYTKHYKNLAYDIFTLQPKIKELTDTKIRLFDNEVEKMRNNNSRF